MVQLLTGSYTAVCVDEDWLFHRYHDGKQENHYPVPEKFFDRVSSYPDSEYGNDNSSYQSGHNVFYTALRLFSEVHLPHHPSAH